MPHQHDHHLTIEELSALLDGQIPDQERSTFASHLDTCRQCQGLLNDLRQTVALLHALPQPELPRSFTLPLNTKVASSRDAETAATIDTPITRLAERRNQRRSSFVPTMIRTFSTLAAVVGLVFVLTGVFHLTTRNETSSSMSNSSGSSATSNQPQATSDQVSPTVRSGGINPNAIPRTTPKAATPQSTPKTTSSQAGNNQQPAATAPMLLDPTQPTGQFNLGVVFLLLAAAGLLAGGIMQRQRARAP